METSPQPAPTAPSFYKSSQATWKHMEAYGHQELCLALDLEMANVYREVERPRKAVSAGIQMDVTKSQEAPLDGVHPT